MSTSDETMGHTRATLLAAVLGALSGASILGDISERVTPAQYQLYFQASERERTENRTGADRSERVMRDFGANGVHAGLFANRDESRLDASLGSLKELPPDELMHIAGDLRTTGDGLVKLADWCVSRAMRIVKEEEQGRTEKDVRA